MNRYYPKEKMQRLLIPLFTFIWWKRLWYEHPHHPIHFHRHQVYKVKGWRTAIMDAFGRGRITISFEFKWEAWIRDKFNF